MESLRWGVYLKAGESARRGALPELCRKGDSLERPVLPVPSWMFGMLCALVMLL
jgi:hypothetical protein